MYGPKIFLVFVGFLALVSARAPDYYKIHEKYSKETNVDKRMHPEFHEKKIYKNSHEAEFNSDYWKTLATKVVDENLLKNKNKKIAKNIILFLGDGLSVATSAAARSYLGDPSFNLGYENLSSVGLAKTYPIDRQVADSACTATAYLCGVKGNYRTIGVNANVKDSDCIHDEKDETMSIAKWALDAGKAAGLITTTRVTHASPAGVFGHTASRDWEFDAAVTEDGCDPKVTEDLTSQLVRNDVGSKLRVIMGGGRRTFRSKKIVDEEGSPGSRDDDIDFIEEWMESKPGNSGTYVWNRENLLKINGNETSYLLGLFEADHMLFNLDVLEQGREYFEPTLTEMVDKAIDVLNTEEKGYFLFVEGGKIDQGHHANRAKQALDETKEFSKAIQMTMNKVDMEETLIVVTSDHSHAFSYAGYPNRDDDIFGTTGAKANDNLEAMIMSYANGLGYNSHRNLEGGRVDPNSFPRPSNFRYPSMIPRDSETHAGDDVGVYAGGPWAHLFTGTYEQNAIPHMMAYAACIGNGLKACDE